MKLCEIYHVPLKGSFTWKWRHQSHDGRVIESKDRYQLYYECVSAAVERGYQPNITCFASRERAALHTQT